MIDTELLRGIITAVVSGAILSIAGFIFRYIGRQVAGNNKKLLMGIVLVALTAGLLYGASLEKISFVWVFGGLFIIILSYGIYRWYFDFPFGKWRVNNNQSRDRLVTKVQRHNCGLLALQSGFDGIPIGRTWMFKTNKAGTAVYGPYIASLGSGKYKAIFKLKVMVGVEDIKIEGRDARSPLGRLQKTDKIDIIKIDVVSCRDDHGWGSIHHVEKTLYNQSFNQANKYKKFKINFEIESEEAPVKGLEMRVNSPGHGHVVVLDYIKLSRKMF